MTAFDDLNILLQNLPNSENVAISLEELRIALTSINPSELTKIVPQLSFAILFQYLDTDNRPQLECCCEVLKKLLQAVIPSTIIPSFKRELLVGLQHHSHFVVELCLEQILRVLENDAPQVAEQIGIVETLVKLLASEQLEIAFDASSCLVKLGSIGSGCKVLLSNDSMMLFKGVLETSDEVRFRVYEVVIKLIKLCPDSLSYIENNKSNLLDMMIAELSPKNPDVLTKLNILEFASDLLSCQHGYDYLERRGFIVAMENSMEDALNDPFLSYGYMKFFGCLCFMKPNFINSRFRSFINVMFSSIVKGSSHTLAIAVESLGIIGSTLTGKLALHDSGEGMTCCLPIIGKLINEPPTEMRLKSLEALQHLFSVPDEECPQAILTVMEGWFACLHGHDPASQIITVSQQPFPELKTAAFAIIKCLAKFPWGQAALKNSAGFQEYLLDRSDNMKEGVIGKYEVVKILVQSPLTEQVFGSSYYERLRDFEKKGEFYSPAVPRVALDNE